MRRMAKIQFAVPLAEEQPTVAIKIGAYCPARRARARLSETSAAAISSAVAATTDGAAKPPRRSESAPAKPGPMICPSPNAAVIKASARRGSPLARARALIRPSAVSPMNVPPTRMAARHTPSSLGQMMLASTPQASTTEARAKAAGTPKRAIVSTLAAEKLFPGVDPIGQRLRTGGFEWEVIGVVPDVSVNAEGDREPTIYHAHAQFAGDRNWAITQIVSTSDRKSVV